MSAIWSPYPLTSALTPPSLFASIGGDATKSSANTISISVTNLARRILAALALGTLALIGSGCMGDQIDATKELVQQQQNSSSTSSRNRSSQGESESGLHARSRLRSGRMRQGVETAASKRGGDKFAAGEFAKALGYYQDALAACPNDERAEVNVARTYEALGNKVGAIKHYRKAADSNSPTVSDAQEEAKAALERLQASRLP